MQKKLQSSELLYVFKDAIKASVQREAQNFNLTETYLIDGLEHCKTCNTPREYLQTVNKTTVKMYQACDCLEKMIKERDEKIKAKKEKEKLEARRAEAIPIPLYRTFTFENDKTPELSEKIRGYAETFLERRKEGKGLLMYGKYGTGKTFYAMCIANYLIDQIYKVKYITPKTIDTYARDFDNTEYHFEKLYRNDCIVLDDLGSERGNDFMTENLYTFVNETTIRGIPLVITTNHDIKDLQKIVHDMSDINRGRIYSRILDRCYPYKVDAKTWRTTHE